jgi:hypothetical protein
LFVAEAGVLRGVGKHRGVPLSPRVLQLLEHSLLPLLEIAAFLRICDDVEQELRVLDVQIFVLSPRTAPCESA